MYEKQRKWDNPKWVPENVNITVTPVMITVQNKGNHQTICAIPARQFVPYYLRDDKVRMKQIINMYTQTKVKLDTELTKIIIDKIGKIIDGIA